MKQVHRIATKSWLQQDDQGSVLVELALVTPVLLLMLLGTIEFGYAFRAHQILQNAVREGARFSVVPGNQVSALNPNATEMAIKQRVIDYCQKARLNSTVSAEEITINQNYLIAYTSATDDGVTGVRGSQVTIKHVHALLFGGAMLPIGKTLALHASVVFRNMY
jgi:Flp pilus assembly protein TadG